MCGWCTIHTSFLLLGNNMTTENDYAKLKELMEFPAKMTFKIAGINREGLAQDLIQVVQKYIKGDYIPKENGVVKVPIIRFQSTLLLKTLIR